MRISKHLKIANIYNNRIRSDRRGIGLLEAMVALLVLMIGIVSVLVLMLSSTLSARISRDQLIAANLAREGVEIVRSVRDSNWLKMEALETHVDGSAYKWDDGLWGNALANPWYGAYPIFNEVSMTWNLTYTDALPEAEVWKVFWKPETVVGNDAIYSQYDAGAQPLGAVPTKYSRRIFNFPICYDGTNERNLNTDMEVCNPINEVKVGVQVQVSVTWIDNGTTRTATTEAKLYNWK